MSTTITDKAGLQNMANALDGDYVLGNAIDASGAAFTPVGDNSTKFTGTFDGASFTITGLNMSIAGNYNGLFGYTNGATISDVILADFDITGEDDTGALVGEADDTTITDCSSSGTVTGVTYVGGLVGFASGGSITDSFSSAVIVSTDDYVGGLVGYNYDTDITDSYATGTVTTTGDYAGGLMGYSKDAALTGCYATGDTEGTGAIGQIGGLVGYDWGSTFTKCYATGDVTGDYVLGGFVGFYKASTMSKCYAEGDILAVDNGGLAGGFTAGTITAGGSITDCYALGDVDCDEVVGFDIVGGFIGYLLAGSTVTNCYSIGVPAGDDDVGGFCGSNDGTITNCFWDTETSGTETTDGGTGKTTAQMMLQDTYTDWDFTEIWNINICLNSGYPFLRWTGLDGGGETREETIGPVYDGKGRVPKSARVEARRADTGAAVETQYLDSSGKATFTELPNDTDVTFWTTWGGTTQNTQTIQSAIVPVTRGGTGASDEYNARSNLGLGSEDSPQFTAVELGHATDTTLARAAAGRATLEGVNVVRGPASATDNRIAKFNLTTGDLIQETGITADDSDNVSGMGTLGCGAITVGSDGAGADILAHGGTASNSLTWDASENVLDIASTMKAADNVLAVTVTDATTLSSGYGRALYLDYTVSGTKTGSYAINGLGIDMTVSEACPTVAALELYTAAISNKTVGNLYPLSIYCEDIGTAVSNFMALDIGINSTNLASSRHTGIRIRNHAGTAKSAILIEEAFTDTILRHSPSGVDLKLITLDNSSGAIFYWDDSEQKFRFNKGLYLDEAPTFTGAVELGHTDIYSGDYGLNWTDLGAVATSWIYAMSYLDNGVVLLGDGAEHIFRSIDYGANWTDLGVIASDDIYAIEYLGNGIAILGDTGGRVYRSTDYGLNWTDLGVIASGAIMPNAKVYLGNGIVILGDNDYHVYRSTDYGATWADLGVVATSWVNSMAYLGSGIALLGDDAYHIYRSTDYGANWADLGVIGTNAVWDIAYLGNGIVIAGDEARHVYRSTDYGANWIDLGVIASDAIHCVVYLGNGIVILADNSYHVYRSINYGVTWTDLGAIAADAIVSRAYLGNGVVLLGDEGGHVFRSTSAFQLWHEGKRLATDVDVSELSTATYDDVQDFINQYGNRGIITGFAVSCNTPPDGTVAVAAGTGWVKTTDSINGVGVFFDFAGDASTAFTDNSKNYIYLDYNGGTPVIAVDTTGALSADYDHILLASCWREGNEVHILNVSYVTLDSIHKALTFADAVFGVKRTSGLVATSTGTRQLAVSSGTMYASYLAITSLSYDTSSVASGTVTSVSSYKLVDTGASFTANDLGKTVKNTTDTTYTTVCAVDSGTILSIRDDIFPAPDESDGYQVYDSWSSFFSTDGGTTWTETEHVTQLDNAYYNKTTTPWGLVALTSNRFAVHWLYTDYEGQHLFMVYGVGDYTASGAEEATVPASLPPIVVGFGVLIAKIIIQEAQNTPTITYPWTTVFTSSLATDHNSLGNLTTGDVHTQYFLLAGETTDAKLHSGADLIVYSDAGSTEKARIDGATGNITTAGTVDGIDVAAHASRHDSGGADQVHSIADDDDDTKIQTEESADEDIIRMDVAGTEAFHLSAAGILTMVKQPLAAGRQTSDQTIPPNTYVPLFFDTEETDTQNEMDLASGSGTAEVGTAGTTLHDDGVFAGAEAGDHIWNTSDETYWVIASVTSNDEVETTAAHDIAVGETFTWFRAKYTVTEGGTYLIVVKILMQAIADTKYVISAIYVDGVSVMVAAIPCSVVNSYPAPTAITMVSLTAGQIVEGYCRHNDTVDRDTRGLTEYDTRYNIIKLA